MRNRKTGQSPHNSSPSLTIRFKHESDRGGNKSETETYILNPDDFALMIENDRRERAQQAGKSIEDIKPRDPQEIVDELWNAEEKVNHEFHRGDRGPGANKCTCGAGCGERRGCRLPPTHPWSLDQMLEIDSDPTTSGHTPEDALIAAEESRNRAADLAAMWAAIAQLGDRHQLVAELMVEQGMSQADVARYLDLSRARVSQLFREVKTAVIEAVEQSRLNTPAVLGSGVRGPADGAGSQPKKGR